MRSWGLSRLVLCIMIVSLVLAACGGGEAAPAEPVEVVEAEEAVEANPEGGEDQSEPDLPESVDLEEAPAQDEEKLVLYESSDGVFHMMYPEGWATNEVPTPNGMAFGIAPNEEMFDQRPDFSEPVLFAFGSMSQVEPQMADPANIANLHGLAYANHALFDFVPRGEPTITQPSPFITYYVQQASSTEPDGAVVHWILATALADLTVVQFGIGVADAGFEQYEQLSLAMFNSVEIDTLVTAELAGGE